MSGSWLNGVLYWRKRTEQMRAEGNQTGCGKCLRFRLHRIHILHTTSSMHLDSVHTHVATKPPRQSVLVEPNRLVS